MPSNFQLARAAEMRRRLLTHLDLAEEIALPVPGGEIAFQPVPLTERHRLEFMLRGNAFFTDRIAGKKDVFQFLWRLSPYFRRPDGTFPNRSQPSTLGSPLSALRSQLRAWLSRRALVRIVRRCDLVGADAAITQWLVDVEQDAPGHDVSPGPRTALTPPLCYADDLVSYFSREHHLSPREIIDLPRALVHQLYRNHQLAQPDGELNVFAPSDALAFSS